MCRAGTRLARISHTFSSRSGGRAGLIVPRSIDGRILVASATRPGGSARRASRSGICDRGATPPTGGCRRDPKGWGDLARLRRCSSVAYSPIGALLAPKRQAKSPPARTRPSVERGTQRVTEAPADVLYGTSRRPGAPACGSRNTVRTDPCADAVVGGEECGLELQQMSVLDNEGS